MEVRVSGMVLIKDSTEVREVKDGVDLTNRAGSGMAPIRDLTEVKVSGMVLIKDSTVARVSGTVPINKADKEDGAIIKITILLTTVKTNGEWEDSSKHPSGTIQTITLFLRLISDPTVTSATEMAWSTGEE